MTFDADTAERSTADDAPPAAVKTLGKALALLDGVASAEHPPTISELAQKVGLTRPTAYRMVQTLVASGFLQQGPVDGRLSIGFAVLPLASSLLDHNRLRLEALPHLQALAQKMNERVNLDILHQHRILILAGSEKPNLPTIYSRFGRSVPMHCCALGKAMLAYLPDDTVREIVAAQPLVARTPNTITSWAALQKDLKQIRARGYSTERGENSPTSCCVGAPILGANDLPVGAISVSGRSIDALIKDIDQVLAAAELISHLL
ncbi:MAG: IclR family transcriptional regulator [Burkholderiales bacterium]|nr:IclR family transcriptional regulator [Burkholderiales bacterium]